MALVLGGSTLSRPDLPCLSWREHGLTWPEGKCGVRRRTKPVRQILLHCTAAENPPRRVFHNLSARKPNGLSVEFVLGSDGVLWQLLDPALHHAQHVGGGLSETSAGLEIVDVGRPVESNPRKRALSSGIIQVVDPEGKWRRSSIKPMLGLTERQARTLPVAVVELCSYFGVPVRMADTRTYVPRVEREELFGVVGHAQVTTKHGDPALDALELFGYPRG